MTLTDYLIDISLIAIVLLQVRGRRITTRAFLLPVAVGPRPRRPGGVARGGAAAPRARPVRRPSPTG